MTARETLLAEIEAFLETSGLAPSAFGRMSLNDTALMTRLRAGSDVRTETADKLREFMREYVPSRTTVHTGDNGRAA